ncbi:hypothetical protein [Micromonospora sp. WMMC250]|uniref:hypothetical protein n=1 Tax=Micromonospora sp. WMMC250 TaxID=3014781 RepID=UPI0022B6F35F|nr:hypothetical protein [Micromonospora sp. WMMC250]MCZ7376287.1 hypothetical protein [Micromonospora sp. WMMC250]
MSQSPRWIIHLPTTLTSLEGVTALAVALRDSLGHLAVVDFGETTLSEEDAQFLRTRVFCDARIDGAGRCRRRDDHDGPCATNPDDGRLQIADIGVSPATGHPDIGETVVIKRRTSRR